MTNGDVLTTNGKKLLLYRSYTSNTALSSTEYLPASQFKVGINNGTPNISNNDIDNPVPISNGTVNDDCNSAFTGSNGGANSTNNTTTFKPGGGVIDNTAQNLITTGSNVNKTWSKTVDANFTAARFGGFWFFIKDAATLAKFKTSGAALTARWQSDATNYYQLTWTAAQLAVGWNWLTTGTALISALPVTGTPSTLDEFYINIETNAAGDAFVAGDVVIDLVRTWQSSDTLSNYVSGYPTIDFTNLEVVTRCYLPTTAANGFDISGVGLFNQDTVRLMTHETTFNSESKTQLDEFAFVIKERIN